MFQAKNHETVFGDYFSVRWSLILAKETNSSSSTVAGRHTNAKECCSYYGLWPPGVATQWMVWTEKLLPNAQRFRRFRNILTVLTQKSEISGISGVFLANSDLSSRQPAGLPQDPMTPPPPFERKTRLSLCFAWKWSCGILLESTTWLTTRFFMRCKLIRHATWYQPMKPSIYGDFATLRWGQIPHISTYLLISWQKHHMLLAKLIFGW